VLVFGILKDAFSRRNWLTSALVKLAVVSTLLGVALSYYGMYQALQLSPNNNIDIDVLLATPDFTAGLFVAYFGATAYLLLRARNEQRMALALDRAALGLLQT
jgi:hypothetical protein